MRTRFLALLVSVSALAATTTARADDCACDRYLQFITQYSIASSAVTVSAAALRAEHGSGYDVDAGIAEALLRDIQSDSRIPPQCRNYVAAAVHIDAKQELKLGGLIGATDPALAEKPTGPGGVTHPRWDSIVYADAGLTSHGAAVTGVGIGASKGENKVELGVEATTGQPQLRIDGKGQWVPVEVHAAEYHNSSGTSSLAISVFPALRGAAEADFGSLRGAQVRLSPAFAAKIMGDINNKFVYSLTFHAGPMAGGFQAAGPAAEASAIAVGVEGGVDGQLSYRIDKGNSIDLTGSVDAYRDVNGNVVAGVDAQGRLEWRHKFADGRSIGFGPIVDYSLYKVQPGNAAIPQLEIFWTGLGLTIHF